MPRATVGRIRSVSFGYETSFHQQSGERVSALWCDNGGDVDVWLRMTAGNFVREFTVPPGEHEQNFTGNRNGWPDPDEWVVHARSQA